jgi:hypothetical protein
MEKYPRFIREFRDVFSYNYDDIKSYVIDVIKHAIHLKKDAKPFP